MKGDRNTSPLNKSINPQQFNTQFSTNLPLDTTPLNMNFNGSLEDAATYYCKEANKLYFANLVLNNQLKSVIEEKNALALKLAKLQKQKDEQEQHDEKKRRHRRTANQIERTFKCPVNPCQKSYGSQGSLSQHLKLKHLQFYKSHMASEGIEGSQSDSESKKEKEEVLL